MTAYRLIHKIFIKQVRIRHKIISQKEEKNLEKVVLATWGSIYIVREGKEILFLSNNIKQPEIENWNPLGFKYIKRKTTANIVYNALCDK